MKDKSIKMLKMFYLLVLFFLTSFAKGELRLCSTRVEHFCREPNPPPDEYIPGNERELRSYCTSTKDYVECLHSYDLACRGRADTLGLEGTLNYDEIKRLLEQACDERSTMHHALGRSLPCIKGRIAAKEWMCSKSKAKILKAYDNYLDDHAPLKPIQKQLRYECLELFSTTACIMENIEKECGFTAYEVALDALSRTQILQSKCEKESLLALQQDINSLNLNDNTKRRLKKYFKVHID